MRTIYLPGASGSASFWQPVASIVGGDAVMLAWPGLGAEPASASVRSIDDMLAAVLVELDEPANIVAQSMGGLIAIKAALARPAMVSKLVLTVTSAGVPVADLGGSDWRNDYYKAFPAAARWIADVQEDLSPRLGEIKMPTMLLWGDADPISPLAVGERLQSKIPNATLHIIDGADHDLALSHSGRVAELIAMHLQA